MTQPETTETDELAPLAPLFVRVVRAGCSAADVHLACNYPNCGCKVVPRTIAAALKEYANG